MSGKRTKRLRAQAKQILGHDPRKTGWKISNQKWSLSHKLISFFQGTVVSKDEFRHFKRHGKTAEQMRTEWNAHLAAVKRHKEKVERNNEHIADLRARREVYCVDSDSRISAEPSIRSAPEAIA